MKLCQEEVGLQAQLEENTRGLAHRNQLMEQLRDERELRKKTFQDKVEKLEWEEGRCRSELAGLTRKKETLQRHMEELSATRSQVANAIDRMTARDPPTPPDVKPEISEEDKSTLRRLKGELSTWDKEIQDAAQVRTQLVSSIEQSEKRGAAVQQLLVSARLKKTSTCNDSAYSERMKELVQEQMEQTDVCNAVQKQLADVMREKRYILWSKFKD